MGPFRLNGSHPLLVAPGNQRVDEAPVIFNRCEVAAAALDQCLFDGFLELAFNFDPDAFLNNSTTKREQDTARLGLRYSFAPETHFLLSYIHGKRKYDFQQVTPLDPTSTITEGRNRQVRRMIEAIDSKVKKLARIAIGPIRIQELEIGKHRNLTPREVELLRG